jgi:hypothetical protein
LTTGIRGELLSHQGRRLGEQVLHVHLGDPDPLGDLPPADIQVRATPLLGPILTISASRTLPPSTGRDPPAVVV